jgi:hypothetical protein
MTLPSGQRNTTHQHVPIGSGSGKVGSNQRLKLFRSPSLFPAMKDSHHHDPTDLLDGTDVPSSMLSVEKEAAGTSSTFMSPLELDQHHAGAHHSVGNNDGTWLPQDDEDDEDDEYNDDVSLMKPNEPSGNLFYNWLYPPQVPRSCQLLRLENLAVPCCYLLVGLSKGLVGPLINVYPLDLNATEAQQVTFLNAIGIPASLKILFGFLSDTVPIWGYRRKSYMILGCLLTSMSLWGLLLFTNLQSLPTSESSTTLSTNMNSSPPPDHNNKSLLPIISAAASSDNRPSIPFLCLSFLLFSTGFWIADVMAESIVAEKAKLEPLHARGSIQSSCYAYRFFGKMIAVPCATYLYSQVGPGAVFALLSALPLAVLPLIWFLQETPVVVGNKSHVLIQHQAIPTTTTTTTDDDAVPSSSLTLPHLQLYQVLPSTREQCQEIWNAVCSRAVWQPMAFVYLFNLLQVNNGAWKQFLKTTLGFTANDLNIILIVTYVLMYFGILAYKYGMLHWSWRSVYILTTVLSAMLSLLQVLLIQGRTFGISKFFFCLGDEAFTDFIHGIQYMPTTIMMVHLCPKGSEGASFAMFTTASNCAQALSRTISTHLLSIWNVSKDSLAHHQLQGLTNLTFLVTALHVSGIFFVTWLPNTKEDLTILNQQTHKSWIGGFAFLLITFLSVSYAIVIGVLNSVAPGWMGES